MATGEASMRCVFASAALLLVTLGCHDVSPVPQSVVCTGDIFIGSSAELDAFVARGCTSVTGLLSVGSTDLTELRLPSLITVEHLSISGNAALVDVGLPSLATVTGSDCTNGYFCQGRGLEIEGNAALTTLDLPALVRIGAGRVGGNSALTDLSIPSLAAVTGGLDGSHLGPLRIEYNDALARVSMPSLVRCGTLSIEQNAALTSLDFGALTTVSDVEIVGNSSLPACEPLVILARLRVAGEDGAAFVSGNGTSMACSSVAMCQGVVTITTASDWAALVDAGCVEIAGNLRVEATDIAELHGNSSLRRIDGYLYVVQNGALTSLTFPGLAVADQIWIVDNVSLASLSLPALTASSFVGLSGNGALPSVNLPLLVSGNVVIEDNGSLTDVTFPALDGLDRLQLGGNAALRQVGFPALARAKWVYVERNPALKSLSLPALAVVEGNMVYVPKIPPYYEGGVLSVAENAVLETASLPALATIGDLLSIRANPALSALEARALTSVGTFVIQDNPVYPQCLAEQVLAQLATAPTGGVTINGNDTAATCP